MSKLTPSTQWLTWTRKDVAQGALIQLNGRIDETFDVATLFNATPKTLIFDLEGVSQITSFGIQAWRTAMSTLNCSELLFINVQPAMMTQFNSVPLFAGKGHIITFLAPYRCHACQIDVSRVIDLRFESNAVTQESPPEVMCPQCQRMADFDDIPDLYFLYVSRTQVPVLSHTALSLLREYTLSPSPIRVSKEIIGNCTVVWLAGSFTYVRTLRRFLEGAEGDTLLFAEELTDVTAHTSHEFLKVLGNINVPVWLSAVPDSFLKATHLMPSNVHLLSVRTELICNACQTPHRRILTLPLVSGKSPDLCPVHATPLYLPLSEEHIKASQNVNAGPPQHVIALIAEAANRPFPSIHASPLLKKKEFVKPSDSNPFGKYVLVEQLGKSHLMEVFKARLRDGDPPDSFVVVKRAIDSLKGDHGFTQTFLTEQEMVVRLRHPNIARVLDFGEVESRAFLVSEYLEGVSLRTALAHSKKTQTPMSLALSLYVIREIAAALNAAHTLHKETSSRVPLIHRELSPHSVFLTMDGTVKVNDFGLGRSADLAQFTPAYASAGRLTYLAPEQIRSTASISDVRVDIFPVGLIFYYCATLEHMFEKTTEYATMWALLNDSVPKLSEHLPNIPPPVEDFLRRCIERDSRLRYQTANDVRVDASTLFNAFTQEPGPALLRAFLKNLGFPAGV